MHISRISILCLCALSSCSFVSTLEEDLYSLLGVSRSASTRDIKRAFRKKAQQYHPDKNKSKEAEAMYLKINRAHDILSDKTKRAQYDKFGEAAFRDGDAGGSGGHDPFDFFSGFSFNQGHDGGKQSIFDSFDDFFSGFGGNMHENNFHHSNGHFSDMFGDIFDDGDSFSQSFTRSSHSEKTKIRTNITRKRVDLEDALHNIEQDRKITKSTEQG